MNVDCIERILYGMYYDAFIQNMRKSITLVARFASVLLPVWVERSEYFGEIYGTWLSWNVMNQRVYGGN